MYIAIWKLSENLIDMDFVIESRLLKKEEETAISEFIRADKERHKKSLQHLTCEKTYTEAKGIELIEWID